MTMYLQFDLRLLATLFFVCSAASNATTLPVEGGPGGAAFEVLCPNGETLVGMAVTSGAWINSIAPLCAPYAVAEHKFGSRTRGRTTGGSGGSPQDGYCPAGDNFVNGLYLGFTRRGSAREYVDDVGMSCSRVGANGVENTDVCLETGEGCGNYNQGVSYGAVRVDGASQTCPSGEAAVGIHGRSGTYVDALGLICAPEPGKSIGTARPAPPSATRDPWSNALRQTGGSSFATGSAPPASAASAPAGTAPAFALSCTGGPGMQAPATDDGFVRIFFKPATQAAGKASPRTGECAWQDRVFRPGEPQMLVYGTAGHAAQDLLAAASRGRAFRVHVFNNGQGAMVVTSIDGEGVGPTAGPLPPANRLPGQPPPAPAPVNTMNWGGAGTVAPAGTMAPSLRLAPSPRSAVAAPTGLSGAAAKRSIIIVGGKQVTAADAAASAPKN